MKTQKVIKASSRFYIGFSILSLAYVSLLSMYSPQSTMDLVLTPLSNTDAISSIRGIYGGVGLVIVLTLIYLFKYDYFKGLIFLTLFWWAYAISRFMTILVDGPLGAFGSQWIVIESVLGALGLILIVLIRQSKMDVSITGQVGVSVDN